MKVDLVVQEEASGCGLACIAMLAGKSYAEIKTLANSLGIFAEDERLWSETTYVRSLAQRLNLQTSGTEEPFETWEALPDHALLSIKYRIEHGRPLWHWVVFHRHAGRAVVLDPAAYLVNNERVDFEQMCPKWFIEVK